MRKTIRNWNNKVTVEGYADTLGLVTLRAEGVGPDGNEVGAAVVTMTPAKAELLADHLMAASRAVRRDRFDREKRKSNR